MGRPLVRSENNGSWIDVFCKGGWKMKTYEYGYITMTAENTKFRNADNTGYITFSCPIPVPTTITRGKVQANRILDSNGYLWCAGYGVGVYDNGQLRSYTWRKVKTGYGANDPLINNIRAIAAGGGFYDMYSPCTIYTFDDRVLFSGYGSMGHRGNGSLQAPSVEYQYGRWRIVDVTDEWNLALGDIKNIAQHDRAGAIVMNDGRSFVVGPNEYQYSSGFSNQKNKGFAPCLSTSSWAEGSVVQAVNHRWTRAEFYDGANTNPLAGVVQMIRTAQHHTLALTVGGQLLQSGLWMANAASLSAIPNPKSPTRAMRDMFIPFTGGAIKRLHQGGVVETVSGELWYYTTKKVAFDDDKFYGFEFINTGINVNTFDSPVVKIAFDWKVVGTVYKPCLFILFDDGRLYASGDNTDGWFGLAGVTGSAIGSVVLINRNVYDFDIEVGNCILVKKDGSIWGAGLNQYGRLGCGNTTKQTEWQQGILSNN